MPVHLVNSSFNSLFWLLRWANQTCKNFTSLSLVIFQNWEAEDKSVHDRTHATVQLIHSISVLTDFTVYFKLIQFKIQFLSLQCFQSTFKTNFALPWAGIMGFNAACINMTVQFSPLLHPHRLHHTSTVNTTLGISAVSDLVLFLWLNQCPCCNRRPVIVVKEKPDAWP